MKHYKVLFAIIACLLCCLLFGCSKAEQTKDTVNEEQLTETDNETIAGDSNEIPALDEEAKAEISKQIDKCFKEYIESDEGMHRIPLFDSWNVATISQIDEGDLSKAEAHVTAECETLLVDIHYNINIPILYSVDEKSWMLTSSDLDDLPSESVEAEYVWHDTQVSLKNSHWNSELNIRNIEQCADSDNLIINFSFITADGYEYDDEIELENLGRFTTFSFADFQGTFEDGSQNTITIQYHYGITFDIKIPYGSSSNHTHIFYIQENT